MSVNMLSTDDDINILIFNITNSALANILKKHYNTFVLEEKKLKKIITDLKRYLDGSNLYSHSDILSSELHNPFILEKASNDFSYWLIEISNVIMDLINSVSDYAGEDIDTGEFKDQLSTYIENLPDLKKLRKNFLDQVPKNVSYDNKAYYKKKDWLSSLDISIDTCEGCYKNLNKIITMIDVLNNHIGKLKMYKNRIDSTLTGRKYNEENNMEEFLKIEMKLHSILEVSVQKMVEYSVIRFSDLVTTSDYIIKDINIIKEEVWK